MLLATGHPHAEPVKNQAEVSHVAIASGVGRRGTSLAAADRGETRETRGGCQVRTASSPTEEVLRQQNDSVDTDRQHIP